MRVFLDLVDRSGALLALVTVPGEAPVLRAVAWAAPGVSLLVAKDQAGASIAVPDAAALANVVDQGRATAVELRRYGGLLFDAAFGTELWDQLVTTAAAAHRKQGAAGLPYLELAIRGGEHAGTQVPVHALRWEALHDGTRAVAVEGTVPSHVGDPHDGTADPVAIAAAEVSVGIVRLVSPHPDSPAPESSLIGGIPRVLFAVGSPLADRTVRPAVELMGIMQELETDGGSIHPRILDEATPSLLSATLRSFQPDVLHLIGHGGRLPDGQVAVQLRPEPGASTLSDEWVTAERLLGGFAAANHTPRLVILSACQTASASSEAASGTAEDGTAEDGTAEDGTAEDGPAEDGPAEDGPAEDGAVNAAPFAARLVAGGVPVVIAMAGDIADTACRMFTRALTSALGEGVPLGTAVLRGRRAAFYQRPGFRSTDWALPSVFLSAGISEQARLVDADSARAVKDRVGRLGLAQAPVFYGRREFIDAMDRLLNGDDRLNVLLGYTPDVKGSFGGERLLRQLGGRAVRLGVLPILLGPFDQNAPTSRKRLAKEIAKSIQNVRVVLGVPAIAGPLQVTTVAADPDAEPVDLAIAIRADIDDLLAQLPAADPVWTRTHAPGQPRAVLLCHRVDKWLDALDDLLGMLGPAGLHPGAVPLPVVATGADTDQLKSTRVRTWSGKPWVKAAPLNRFPAADDEDLLAYQWWLLNPPDRGRVYAPKKRAPHEWGSLLRLFMGDSLYDEDKLYSFASSAPVFFTSEMDYDLLASFAKAAP